jgi:hypothetical protein
MVRRRGFGARPLDEPPDPCVVVPCGNITRLLTLNACEDVSAEGRDLLEPRPSSRSLDDGGSGAGVW